ncbi:MAG: hypothetical protein KBC56_08995 [Flavobacterium sp.]|nr:hypothetical protein [Flavobacterium sp.]
MNLKFTQQANGTKVSGIMDYSNDPPTLFCYCTEQNADLILKGMASLQRKKREVKTFQIPTIEEVQEYCKLIQSEIDPETFFLHYQTNGWMVGKVKMKDWRSAVKNWTRKETKTIQKEKAVIGRQTQEVVKNNLTGWNF